MNKLSARVNALVNEYYPNSCSLDKQKLINYSEKYRAIFNELIQTEKEILQKRLTEIQDKINNVRKSLK